MPVDFDGRVGVMIGQLVPGSNREIDVRCICTANAARIRDLWVDDVALAPNTVVRPVAGVLDLDLTTAEKVMAILIVPMLGDGDDVITVAMDMSARAGPTLLSVDGGIAIVTGIVSSVKLV